MALTKITGQVINDTTGLVVGVTTVGGGVSAVDGFFSGIVTFSNDVSIAGTLTYEDVTNVNSVGNITVGSGITLSKDGDIFFTGIMTGNGSGLTGIAATDNVRTGILDVAGVGTFRNDVNIPDKIIHLGDTDTAIRFPAADTVSVETGGSERARITSGGQVLIGNTADPSDYNSGADDLIIGNHSSASGITILSPTSNSGFIMFSDNNGGGTNAYRGQVEYYHGDDYMRFMTASGERIRFGSSGQIGIAGANYGTSGQVLQSQGSSSAVQWATPSLWTHGTRTDISGSDGYTFTGVPDGASHIRYVISYFSASEAQQPNLRLEKSTTGGSKSIITSGYQSYSTYLRGSAYGGGGKTTSVELWYAMTNAANTLFGTIDIYRLGSNGTEYNINFQGLVRYSGTDYATAQANGYVDLGSSSTDFISGARLYLNGGTIDGGYASQSYQTP